MDEDIIWINDDKNMEFLSQDLIDVILEVGLCIKEPKKHYVRLRVTISSSESYFLFLAFFDPYSMISAYRIELDEWFGLT